MKKIVKAVLGCIGFVYLLFIIFVTVCLLNYNKYKVTQIKDKTFILIDDKSDKYNNGDLVVFTRGSNDDIIANDEISFYEVVKGTSSVNIGTVTDREKISDKETTFVINGSHKISSEFVIGKTAEAKVFPKLGKLLYVFESQYGFLLLVIFPSLMVFFYAAYSFINELKHPVDDEDDEEESNDDGNNNDGDDKETSDEEKETERAPIKIKPRENSENNSPVTLKRPSEINKNNDL